MVTVLREFGVDLWSVGALPLGVGLDLALGYSSRKPCPGLAIGWLVDRAERGLRVAIVRRGGTAKVELVAGLMLSLMVLGLVGGLVWLAVEVLDDLGGPSSLVGRAILIAWGLSFGRLGGEVVRASEAPHLVTARRAASGFLGLSSSRLDQDGIRRACVQVVGERANRMVVAPLFWLAIAGPAGLWSYLAIETLVDKVVSVGPRSRFFGFAAARLDDLANFVPARVTWLLLALSAALLGEDAGTAFRHGLSLGRRNSDRPGVWGSATVDGALGLQPGGIFASEPTEPRTVRRAVLIVQVAGFHAVALAIAYRIVVMRG